MINASKNTNRRHHKFHLSICSWKTNQQDWFVIWAHIYLELDLNNIWSLHYTSPHGSMWKGHKFQQVRFTTQLLPIQHHLLDGHIDGHPLQTLTTFTDTTRTLLKVSTQQIKSDGKPVQGQIFQHKLYSSARKHSIGKNPTQTESQQLPAGLFRVPAWLWPSINVPSSDNNCGKGACSLGNKSKSECEWERDWWLKGAAFWLKPFDGADV